MMLNREELTQAINAKIEDEAAMVNQANHSEYYKGRQDAFQFVLDLLDPVDLEPSQKLCTQNEGDCSSCSLVNYGRDCENNPV